MTTEIIMTRYVIDIEWPPVNEEWLALNPQWGSSEEEFRKEYLSTAIEIYATRAALGAFLDADYRESAPQLKSIKEVLDETDVSGNS